MWISQDKYLDMKLSAEVYKDTSEAWKRNYEKLAKVTDRDESVSVDLERSYSNRIIDLDRKLSIVNKELENYKSALRDKDDLIESLLFTNMVKEKIENEKE